MSTNLSIYHDLHQHTFLSSCSTDPEMLPQHLLDNAIKNGYDTICVTDHVWDPLIPLTSSWYAPQTVEHVRQSLPLPSAPNVRFCFGCETEFCGGDKLGLAESSFVLFDFVVIPVNHFHMIDFVRPSTANTVPLVAELMLKRLEELQQLKLPWEKIGVAHFTCDLVFLEGMVEDVIDFMPEERLMKIFDTFARLGAGIELNARCFSDGWDKHSEILLRPYRLAKNAGCKFYFASDAHTTEQLSIKQSLLPVISALSLNEEDLYGIP